MLIRNYENAQNKFFRRKESVTRKFKTSSTRIDNWTLIFNKQKIILKWMTKNALIPSHHA